VKPVFFRLPESAAGEIARVEALLQEHNPWPQRELSLLGDLAVNAPEGLKRFADFRRILLDIEGLVQDSRWAVGNGLLMLRVFPEISEPLSDVEDQFDHLGIPAKVHLLLSGLLADRERVIFQDVLERQPGGKRVGAWMIRVLADHAVISNIAVLDRLSHLLILSADVDPPRNRMYFRSGKFELLRNNHGVPISDSLIRLAEGEELTFLLDYRDGLAHTVRLNSAALGAAAVDEYFDESGHVQRIRSATWSSEELLGIALMSSTLVRTALRDIGQHCQALLHPGI
jgi:hypothetical protein